MTDKSTNTTVLKDGLSIFNEESSSKSDESTTQINNKTPKNEAEQVKNYLLNLKANVDTRTEEEKQESKMNGACKRLAYLCNRQNPITAESFGFKTPYQTRLEAIEKSVADKKLSADFVWQLVKEMEKMA